MWCKVTFMAILGYWKNTSNYPWMTKSKPRLFRKMARFMQLIERRRAKRPNKCDLSLKYQSALKWLTENWDASPWANKVKVVSTVRFAYTFLNSFLLSWLQLRVFSDTNWNEKILLSIVLQTFEEIDIDYYNWINLRIFLSRRPGLKRAGSSVSGRLVAMIILT